MSSNFNCSYMTMSKLTYILVFFVNFFFQPIYTDYTNQTYFDKRSPLNLLMKLLNQIKANLAGMVLGWSLFNIVSDSAALHSKWLLLPKIEISLVVNLCFITNKNELKFYLQLHGNEQFNIYFGFFCEICSASLFHLGIL